MSVLGNRFKNAWNAFKGRDPTSEIQNGSIPTVSYGSSYNPNQRRHYVGSDKSIVMSIYNQIAVDCAAININHVRLDENGKFKEIIDDSLNQIFSDHANIDQTGRDFIIDIVISLLDEGYIALVPTITDENLNKTDSFKVYEARVGKIVEWFPREVRVEVYNEAIGQKQTILVEKRYTPIIENPFYSIMNEPNSTLHQYKRVLNQLNQSNDVISSNKIDLIVQLPYTVKTKAKQTLAESRRKDIEAQLTNSEYGIAYIDGAEKVIQLNRSVENTFREQAKELKTELYNELGMAESIFDGTADEATLLNYNNRTIEPILSAIVEAVQWKWLTITAKSQRQAIRFYKDPFKLVPVSQLAEIADKFTRNAIMTSNEFRSVIGMKPFDDPKANMLINHNLNQPEEIERQAKEKSNENSKSE